MQIMHLPMYITNVQHDKTLCHEVGQYQEDVNKSLLTLLFSTYDLVPDQEFQTIIYQKWHEYDMDKIVAIPALMAEAIHKYNVLNCGPIEHWMAKTPHEQYQAEKCFHSKQTFAKYKDEEKQCGSIIENKKKNADHPDWLEQGTWAGEPESKVVEGHTYHWCKYHGHWSLNSKHFSSMCTGCGHCDNHKAKCEADHLPNDGQHLCIGSALASIHMHEGNDKHYYKFNSINFLGLVILYYFIMSD